MLDVDLIEPPAYEVISKPFFYSLVKDDYLDCSSKGLLVNFYLDKPKLLLRILPMN